MFERTLEIIDKNILDKLHNIKVLLVGLGGVGGTAFESLIRLGVTNITIIDYDLFDITNLNRQILSTTKNLGQDKCSIAKTRGLEINKDANIIIKNMFLTNDNINELTEKYDYIIDACDTITTKVLLIKKALKDNSKIISCMGTGNRIKPNLIEITKLNKTYNDPLAKSLRSILKKENIPLNIPVIWSSELPIKTKNRTPGSIMLVPSSAGLMITYYILNDLINNIK